MKMVIGYDGSAAVKDAIYALGRAGLPSDANVQVVSVTDVWPHLPPSSYGPSGPASGTQDAPILKNAHALAARALDDARSFAAEGAAICRAEFPGWKVIHSAETGSPFLALIEPSEGTPDLVVVGAQGRSGLERLMLGSVSQSVLTHASCSVHISRRTSTATAGAGAPVKIILGIDGSIHSALAVSAVAARPWPAGTQVKVITAMDLKLWSLAATPGSAAWAPAWARMEQTEEDVRSWASEAVATVAEELHSAGLIATSAIVEGDPKRVLLEEARTWAADCIFVGAKGHSVFARLLLGSVSAAIATRAKCSVEVVRHV